MGNSLVIIGVAVICFLILYVMFNLRTKDQAFNVMFQVIGLAFFLGLIILIPKVAVDDEQFCNVVVENATVSGGQTSYDYTRLCFDNPNDTSTTFFVAITWFVRIVSALFALYFGYHVLKWLIEKVPRWTGKGAIPGR